MHIRPVQIDLGKTTFQLVALGDNSRVLFKQKFTQKQLITFTSETSGRPPHSVSKRVLCAARRGIIMRLSMATISGLGTWTARGEIALRAPWRKPGGGAR